MPTRIEIPSAWQTVDPKTRDDLRRIRVALAAMAKQLAEQQTLIESLTQRVTELEGP